MTNFSGKNLNNSAGTKGEHRDSASTKYQAYPEYIDTGIEWYPSIPKGWNLLRYKNSLKIFQGMAFKSTDYVDYSDVVNIRMGNIKKGGEIDLEHNVKYLPTSYAKAYQNYQLKDGEIIMAMTDMSPSLDFLAVPALLKGCDPNSTYLLNQRVGKLIINSNIDVRFLKYSLLSTELRSQLKALGLGTVQANMSNDDLYGAYYPAPSDTDTSLIANFLDHETAKIDTLIEQQQQLIQLLKEKRQAVISHAVTKGLNPDAPMKDSGVEWLGEVPAHWDIPNLNQVAHKIGDGLHSTPEYESETGYYFINGNNLIDGKIVIGAAKEVPESSYRKHYIELTTNSVLLSINGTVGNVAVFSGEKVILGKSAAFINCKAQLLCGFLLCYLQSNNLKHFFELEVTGTTIFNLSLNSIRKMKVCVPPIEEQKEIERFCVIQKEKYDQLISNSSAAITLMQERRTALISAAVTGKIDVRNWQAPQQ